MRWRFSLSASLPLPHTEWLPIGYTHFFMETITNSYIFEGELRFISLYGALNMGCVLDFKHNRYDEDNTLIGVIWIRIGGRRKKNVYINDQVLIEHDFQVLLVMIIHGELVTSTYR